MAAEARGALPQPALAPPRAAFSRPWRDFSPWSILLLAGVFALAGCGHAPPRPGVLVPSVPGPSAGDNRLAAEVAASMIGRPYRAGGNAPEEGFDCSGLVRYCYGLLGIELPRTADTQQKATRPVPVEEIAIGDLLFFRLGGAINHVGIYYGDGLFVHSPSSGKGVMRSRLDSPYWQSRLASVGRPLPASQAGAGSRPRSSSGVFTNDGRSAAATGALSRKP